MNELQAENNPVGITIYRERGSFGTATLAYQVLFNGINLLSSSIIYIFITSHYDFPFTCLAGTTGSRQMKYDPSTL